MNAERVNQPALPAITQSLCQRCGACCSAVVDGELVSCQHLDTRNGFRCRIYATRPQVCRDYSCIRDGRVSAAVEARVHAAIHDTVARAEIVFGRLPKMTSPLGRHWPQPDGLRDRVRIFETHATIDESDWEGLPRYDHSFPSGAYSGKAWRMGKFLYWYGRERDDDISIGCARALVQTNGTHAAGPSNVEGTP